MECVFGGILQPWKVSLLRLLPQKTSHTHIHSSFSEMVPTACALLQCSRSCGSGFQRRELHCGERDQNGGYVPSAVHHAQKACGLICVLASETHLTTEVNRQTRVESKMCLPVQVCGLPHTEVQEYCQTSGGPPAGMQPRSVPGAEPCSPQQNRLHHCGSRLVLISMATGQFPNFWNQPHSVFNSFSVASDDDNNAYIQKWKHAYGIKSIPLNKDHIVFLFVSICQVLCKNLCQVAGCLCVFKMGITFQPTENSVHDFISAGPEPWEKKIPQ